MSRELVLELHGVSVAHAGRAPVLSDIHLRLERGFTGVVGANGAGKTTLLRVLAGALAPSSGVVRREPRDALVVRVVQEATEATDDVVRFGAEEGGLAAELRGRLALDPAPLERWPTLSAGERQRWQIGAALAREPDVLLLDEPTNHLDAGGRALLVSALRRFRGIGILVSHDRAFLDALATRTIRVHEGRAEVYAGSYEEARATWTASRHALERAHADARTAEQALAARLDEARREHASASRGRNARTRMKGPRDSDARGALAKGMAAFAEARAGRTVSVLRQAHARAAEAIPHVERDRTLGSHVFAGWERAPKPVLFHVDRDVVPAREAPDVAVLRDVRLTIGRDDRVRLVGPNGAGKSTLLAVLLEGGPPRSRVLVLHQELSVADVAAEIETLRALSSQERGRALSVFAALGSDPEQLLARLGARGVPAETVARSLSPGEARKLLLASGLGRHVWALVLDEPENHLDLPSVERLERALALYPGCIVLVTHDDAFAASCTRRVVRVDQGAVV